MYISTIEQVRDFIGGNIKTRLTAVKIGHMYELIGDFGRLDSVELGYVRIAAESKGYRLLGVRPGNIYIMPIHCE